MKRTLILSVVAVLVAGRMLLAAEEPAKIAPEQLAAAQELLQAMLVDKTFDESIERMVDLQVRQNPRIAPFKQVMLDFFRKYMSWDSLKDDMARIYAEEFAIPELKELTAFYKTPVGQKAAAKMPILMNKGAELGMQRVREHMAELQQMMTAAAQNQQQKEQKEQKPQ